MLVKPIYLGLRNLRTKETYTLRNLSLKRGELSARLGIKDAVIPPNPTKVVSLGFTDLSLNPKLLETIPGFPKEVAKRIKVIDSGFRIFTDELKDALQHLKPNSPVKIIEAPETYCHLPTNLNQLINSLESTAYLMREKSQFGKRTISVEISKSEDNPNQLALTFVVKPLRFSIFDYYKAQVPLALEITETKTLD